MPKFEVTFDVRKNNSASRATSTVEAPDQYTAQTIAENKMKIARPAQKDYVWSLISIKQK
ncbi:hypothetical protein [Rosenbergiella epipactidis]|uniref:hypothetical protein n=1 Tax=Rosenbergiella epipactidis TaxID=1544694 RepID=UPI001F4E9C69|nr:hypothetical protein [Rosenbergiella epipactidis]